MTGEVPDDRALQSAILAYLSDMTLLDTANFAHGRTGFDPDLQMASLDHAMWFHRPHPLDDWLLYAQDSPNMIGSRGLSRGLLYGRDGTADRLGGAGRADPPAHAAFQIGKTPILHIL
jgi:acyl-CoA thioesterase II